ncbi:MAG: hypothetical protein PVF26_21445 [Desulfobacterales bacterium]|jgi:hypothetical protein
MTLPVPASKNLTLDQVREQFEHWRRTREKKGAIPEALWEAAVSLNSDYSLCKIAKALHLGYYDLKKRIKQESFSPSSDNRASFVELDLSGHLYNAECIVEMKDKKGATMRMYFKGKAGIDLLELGKTFWNKR